MYIYKPMNPEALHGDDVRDSDNLASLKEMTEESIVEQLEKRYWFDCCKFVHRLEPMFVQV